MKGAFHLLSMFADEYVHYIVDTRVRVPGKKVSHSDGLLTQQPIVTPLRDAAYSMSKTEVCISIPASPDAVMPGCSSSESTYAHKLRVGSAPGDVVAPMRLHDTFCGDLIPNDVPSSSVGLLVETTKCTVKGSSLGPLTSTQQSAEESEVKHLSHETSSHEDSVENDVEETDEEGLIIVATQNDESISEAKTSGRTSKRRRMSGYHRGGGCKGTTDEQAQTQGVGRAATDSMDSETFTRQSPSTGVRVSIHCVTHVPCDTGLRGEDGSDSGVHASDSSP